jgi:hypothetical protein
MSKNISSENLSVPESKTSDIPADQAAAITNEKLLAQLQVNEKLNRDILKSVKFLKNYFAWQSVMSTIKYAILLAVIVLGIVSWNTIVDYTRQTMNSYLVGVKALNN